MRAEASRFLPVLPLVLGGIIFLAIFGFPPLDPCNLEWWPQHDDPLQSWLGWTFFRNSPWSWPPGLNPLYGLEMHNSIVYTDSIPLLALFFKLLNPVLPQVFQYLGWWLLACYCLQALFAWKLTGLYVKSIPLKLLAAAFFCFSPLLLHRAGMHMTLAGQFLILAALYLGLRRGHFCFTGWLFLIAFSALIHAYLLFMVFCIWLGAMGSGLWQRSIGFREACIWTCIIGLVLLACCWLAGYFAIRPGGAGGFGMYKMNLLSLFDPNDFSSLLRDLPGSEFEEEGFNYLGAGGILLLAYALPALINRVFPVKDVLRNYWPLLLACLCLALLAVSNVPAIGGRELSLPVPEGIERWLNVMFRASGRFFWPVFYLLILASIYCVARYYKRRTAVWLLVLVLAAQIVDLAPAWSRLRNGGNDFMQDSPLRAAIWSNPKYKKISVIPFLNASGLWKPVGLFAALHGLGTDAIYVSRTDDQRLARLYAKNDELVKSGKYEPDTLYILDEATFAEASKANPDAFMGRVDGFYVIAPN